MRSDWKGDCHAVEVYSHNRNCTRRHTEYGGDFYIGGLVNQFNLNYQKWLAEGGITGKATMDAICFSPVCCWRSAMTASGLKCVALVAVIGSGVYLFIHFQDRFGNGDYDPRNFSRSKRGTYGTAGWMSDKEMRAILEISSPGHAKGLS